MNSNRKRARLDAMSHSAITAPAATSSNMMIADGAGAAHLGVLTTTTTSARCDAAAVSSSVDITKAHRFFLTQRETGSSNNNNRLNDCTTVNNVLPANVFLTICDESSDEDAEEYLFDSGSLAAHIKQEQDAATQTQATQPLHYRIVNQLQRQQMQLQLEAETSNPPVEELTSASTLLPAAVQLPNGCEIYLVKEYIDTERENGAQILSPQLNASHSEHNLLDTASATIKMERTEAHANNAIGLPSITQQTRGSTSLKTATIPTLLTNKVATNATQTLAAGTAIASGKRNFMLETYKKRDDKRRATHNEVERRRRDKINSWIFKLKEMLPTEGGNGMTIVGAASELQRNGNGTGNSNCNHNNNNNSNTRTTSNDSKSQILIKACEYIKTMQDEMKSLRECLTENENLRSCNQRLQNELNKLKHERTCSGFASKNTIGHTNKMSNKHNSNNNNNSISQNSQHFQLTHNSNSIFGVNTTAANTETSAASTAALGILHTSNTGGVLINTLTPNAYTKRELIIRDYVD